MSTTTERSMDLRLLVSGCVWPDQFDARDLPQALRAVTALLSQQSLEYVLVGRLALARYCRPQLTDQIDIRLGRGVREADIERDLKAFLISTLQGQSTVSLTIGRSHSDIEDDFIARALIEPWLSASVRMALPEHFLWLALEVDTPEAAADAERLLHSGAIDLTAFKEIVGSSDARFSARLRFAEAWAAKTAASNYGSSVERRLGSRPQSLTDARRNGR